jgi:XTP/dITP diphosphohydrolase
MTNEQTGAGIPPSPFRRLLVIGTANRKKGEELRELLAVGGIEIHTLADYPQALAVDETGDSFAANARLKATAQARHLVRWVVADDSGLAVDALGGLPGVRSARYAGANASDEANNQRLLQELAGLPLEERTARFVCHMALADSTGAIRAESEAYCCGRIVYEARGGSGFGYDPLFEIPEYHRTFGELGTAVKSLLSHRSRAARRLLAQLAALMRDRE